MKESSEEIYLTYLNALDIEALQITDDEVLGVIEDSLKAQGLGQTVVEPRVHLYPRNVEFGRYNVLRGILEPANLVGVKVVANYRQNWEIGLPSEICTLNLYDPRNGKPVAFIDATEMTFIRTGAVTAVGAKYLAPKKSKILGHIGARGVAYWDVRLLDHMYDFDEIRVHSERKESREAFAERLRKDLNKDIVVTDNWRDCVEGADIVLEASRLKKPEPLLNTDWIKPGAYVCVIGSQSAVDIRLTDIMSKILVDDWGQCKIGNELGALRAHVDTGKLNEQTLYAEMGDVVAGKKPGRERDDETILFWHRGIPLSDIALGHLYLTKSAKMGIGQRLRFL